jgi:hypothetical protein
VLTALTFVLTLEDPYRFAKSRMVGAYLGLVPAIAQSGDRDPREKRISKEGDEMLRRLLVGSAHYILGPFAKDSAYSPWLNPIEMFWRHFRREVTHCELFPTIKALVVAAYAFFDRYNR